MFLSVSNAITAATDNTDAAREREQTGSDGQSNARNNCKPMGSPGIEPRRRPWRPATTETGLRQDHAPRRSGDYRRSGAGAIVAARQGEQFDNSEFDVGTRAVVFVFICRNRKRPRAVMPASGVTVVWLRGCVLMTPAEAQNRHAASSTASDSMNCDNHGQQDGERAGLHRSSIPRPSRVVA